MNLECYGGYQTHILLLINTFNFNKHLKYKSNYVYYIIDIYCEKRKKIFRSIVKCCMMCIKLFIYIFTYIIVSYSTHIRPIQNLLRYIYSIKATLKYLLKKEISKRSHLHIHFIHFHLFLQQQQKECFLMGVCAYKKFLGKHSIIKKNPTR